MGKHSKQPEKDLADQDSGTFSGDLNGNLLKVEDRPKTFERDFSGVQGFEYF